MSDNIVAHRYAKALVGLAVEKNVLNEVNKDMKYFLEVMDSHNELEAVMANPIIRHNLKYNILEKLFKDKINPTTFSIFDILAKKNREKLIKPIATEFGKIYDDLNKVQKVKLAAAVPLSESQAKAIEELVHKETKRKVEIDFEINEDLIGGFVLHVGDTQLDTSVKKKLNELKLSLI